VKRILLLFNIWTYIGNVLIGYSYIHLPKCASTLLTVRLSMT